MHLRVFSLLVTFCLGAFGGIWAQVFLLPFFATHAPFQEWQFVKDWSARVTVISPVQEIVIRESDGVEKAIERGQKVTVGIQSARGTTILEGSGVIATADGFVLTLANLVPPGYEITVFHGETGQALGKAEVVNRDTKNNLALLKLDKENLPTASFATEENLKLGMTIVFIGMVLREEEGKTVADEGIVAAIRSDRIETNLKTKSLPLGSTIVDLEGRIVGLTFRDQDGNVYTLAPKILNSFLGLQ